MKNGEREIEKGDLVEDFDIKVGGRQDKRLSYVNCEVRPLQ